jgi:hypothetical protein
MTETHELVVPKSIPMTSAAEGFELKARATDPSLESRGDVV